MREKILEICMATDESVDYTSDALIDDGLLDSVTLVEIASNIMDELEIEIPYEEIIPENFNSIDAMVELVEKYA